MKSAAVGFLVTILSVSSAFSQVHIRESATIMPELAKKVQDGGSGQCKVRVEISSPSWCNKRIRIWGGSGTCNMDSAFVLSASTDPLTGEIDSPPSGIYNVWVQACFKYGDNSFFSVREFYNDSLVRDDTLKTTDWYNCPDDYLNGFATPYYSDFYFDLKNHGIPDGDSSGMDMNGNFYGNCNMRWLPTDPVTMTVISGSQYVSFHETATNTKIGTSLTVTGADIGKYTLVADGAPADSFDTWVVVQAQSDGLTKEDSVQIFPSADHFFVYTAPDTIDDSAITVITVQAQDKADENMGYSGNVQISASPSEYGHLAYSPPIMWTQTKKSGVKSSQTTSQSANTEKKKFVTMGDSVLEVDYSAANSGNVSYTADGIAPDTNTTINFTVTAVDQTSITGEGWVVIKGTQPELVVVYPTDELKEEHDITKDPLMPNITPQAQLLNYDGGTVNFEWNLRVQWEGDDGRKFDDSFHDYTTAQNSNVSSWPIKWDKIRGGDEITLDVTASTADGKDYDKTVNHGFIIKGDNPDKSTVKKSLTVEEQVIAYMESRFRQFWNDGDFPVFGPEHGYGMMQLDPPSDNEQVWDWKANIAEGQSRFAGKEASAKGYPASVRKRGGKYHYATNYTQQEFLTDAFQLYNGWHYWIWAPLDPKRPSLGGHWIKDPDLGKPKAQGGYGQDYGGPAMQIYNNVVNGNPPSDW